MTAAMAMAVHRQQQEQMHAKAEAGLHRRSGESGVYRKPLSLDEVKNALRQDPVIFAHLMNGTSPFGGSHADQPVPPTWTQDAELLALQLMHRLNGLKEDENGVTLVIACDGAYQKGAMGHLMIWNVWLADGCLKLQTGNQESIGNKHYPTALVNTVDLWEKHNPTGSRNSNAPGIPVDDFLKTPVGISLARYGLCINLFPCTAAENFEPALTMLSAMEAGQDFGFFDGQKSCFTTARDLLGATRTRGPQGEEVDWGAGKPQPVVPEIINKLSLVTNNAWVVGTEVLFGKPYDLTDAAARQAIAGDKMLIAALAVKLGGWINKKPGAYAVRIRPALQATNEAEESAGQQIEKFY